MKIAEDAASAGLTANGYCRLSLVVLPPSLANGFYNLQPKSYGGQAVLEKASVADS